MFRAIGIEAPTYVDDLAGLINGPAQAMRASYYIPDLGKLGRRTGSQYSHVPQAHVRV